jgi:hypothetical protein
MMYRIFFLIFLLSLSGCSILGLENSDQSDLEVLEATDGLPGSETMPFSLRVIEELNDGKELHILGMVAANTTWDPDTVVLKLTSLKDGMQVGVSHNTLRTILKDTKGLLADDKGMIEANEEVSFSLAAPSEGITDYQIALLWGDEAERYVSKKTSKGTSERTVQGATTLNPRTRIGNESLKLRVRSIEIETLKASCPYPPCDVRFRLKALLVNEGDAPIKSAKLGVGFVPTELFGIQEVPESEEQVDIPNLNLKSGGIRPFRILLDQEMPEEIAGTVKPVLRILSFEGE